MMVKSKYFCCAQILALAISLPAFAEESASANQEPVNIIPVGSQSQALRDQLQVPKQSQTMDQVLDLLGDPNQVFTVGNPKITRWIYGNMTVYFEKDQVLRAVVHEPSIDTTTIATQQQ